ncbi:MAG: hypothetical protein RL760_143 [Candidatus Eisenbacteria bacterium]
MAHVSAHVPPPTSAAAITAVVVTYESTAVLERCLASLRAAAPRRGVRIVVADNASRDGTADRAAALLGDSDVVRLAENRGFAAGVNAGFAAASTPFVAVVNPDVEIPAGGLDALVEVLERHPEAGLVGPAVVTDAGSLEATVGAFPTPEREWAHSWLLDRLGWPGRFVAPPARTAAVDWVSGCAWLVRAEAARAVGPLDEAYFMYYEDVDWCRRMHDAGWLVLHAPEVRWRHGVGRGSSATGTLPADGGVAALRYFTKFHPTMGEARARALLVRGWRLRLAWRRVLAALGHARSAAVAQRYRVAIEQVGAR